MQLELHSPLLLLEMAKWEAPSGRDSLARLAPVKLEALQGADPLAKAMHLAPAKRAMSLAIRRLAKANRSSVKED
jgi:hypothetical protein